MNDTPTTSGAPARFRWAIPVAVFLIFALIIWGYVKQVHPRIFPKRFGVVDEAGLYRSGRIHPDLMPRVFEEYGIETIVTMTFPVEGHPFQSAEKRIADDMGINIYRFPLGGDGLGDYRSYVGALERINTELQAGRKVLVHCAAGTERTGGVSYFYQTLFEGKSRDVAHEFMLEYEHDPERNPKLIPFLDEITDQVSEDLRTAGVLAPAS